jgi:glycosyltransferase involved in cell wall biosynthesis
MTRSDARRPRIVFIEQFYYPEGWGGAQLPRDITMRLAGGGWDVTVICGSDIYAAPGADDVQDPSAAGVKIRRVPRLLRGDIHRLKLLRQLCFYLAAFPLLLVSRADLYVTQTNPPLIVPLAAIAALVRRRPLIVIAQDIYPEVVFAHGMMSERSLAGRLLRSVFSWAYRRAQQVVSLGPTMSERLVAKGVARGALTEISNWATGAESIVRGPENSLREAWGLAGKFVLLYSGNMGIAHDVATPLRSVAAALKRMPELALLFIGSGSRAAEAQALARELGIEHAVQFRPFVSAELLPHSLGLADLALVTLRPGFEGLVVPSKLFGYMARAVPTLYIGPSSDIGFYLDASGGGLSFANGTDSTIAERLLQLRQSPDVLEEMGKRAQRYYLDQLSQPTGLARYSRLLADVAGLTPAPGG